MNEVKATFAKVMSGLGLAERGGSWYLHGANVIVVVELQKSNYGLQHFINVAVWLSDLDDARFPKEHVCHVRTRLTQLVSDPQRLSELLDLEKIRADPLRVGELDEELTTALTWVLESVGSLAALRSERGASFLARSLVTGPAQRLISGGQGSSQ